MNYIKMVEKIVLKSTGEYDKKIIEHIVQSYSPERVKYAYANNMSLFDLDAWEYACKIYKEGKLKKVVDLVEFPLSDNLDKILTDGSLFLEISRQMWEYGYEFMEFENYKEKDWFVNEIG